MATIFVAPTSLAQRLTEANRRSRVVDVPLQHGPLAPVAARHATRDVLTHHGWDEDDLYEALLVVSELVTNAVTHAQPPTTLHLYLDTGHPAWLQIRVTDGGPNPNPAGWATHRPDDEHHRGHQIITTIATTTGSDTSSSDGPDTLIDHWATLHTA